MSLTDLKREMEAINQRLTVLQKAFRDHQHTGLDAKPVDVPNPITNQGSITAVDESSVDAVYDSQEAAVINNTRSRVNEIEDALIAIGLLS